MRAAVPVALAGLVGAGLARAEPIPVLLVVAGPRDATGHMLEGARSPVRRVREALGPDALANEGLARALSERYAAPAVQGDPLAGLRERARAARRACNQATERGDGEGAQRALAELDAAAQELESSGAALDASTEGRRALELALVFLSERHESSGAHARAEDAMRRLARVDPTVAFSATAASPPVQQYYARAVASMLRGSLSVESRPAGCTVLRDGREAGSAPVELQDLPAGAHRIAVRCGAVTSLVHPVLVAPRTRATLVLDARLDASLEYGSEPALRYESESALGAQLTSDAAALGRALSARRVYAVHAGSMRASVIDATSGALVGEASVDDAAALRALLRAPSREGAPSGGATGAASMAAGTLMGAPGPAPSARVPWGSVAALWVTGLGLGGAGAYGVVYAGTLEHRALQSDDAQRRYEALEQAPYLRYGGYAAIGVGSALFVSGVFVALFARYTPPSAPAATRVSLWPAGLGVQFERVF